MADERQVDYKPHSSEQDAAQIKWRKPKVQSMSFLGALPKAGD
jgi:hypothetical protein